MGESEETKLSRDRFNQSLKQASTHALDNPNISTQINLDVIDFPSEFKQYQQDIKDKLSKCLNSILRKINTIKDTQYRDYLKLTLINTLKEIIRQIEETMK